MTPMSTSVDYTTPGLRSPGIVLDDFRAIFMPIPKVGSTSVMTGLADVLGFQGDVHADVEWPRVHHETIWSRYRDWFIFAFVRNPWDRLLSCYLSKLHPDKMDDPVLRNGVEPEFWKYGDTFHAEMSFEDFVRATAAIPDEEADIHFGSQYRHVTDPDGNVVVDFLGRFESLADDFKHVCEKIGLPASLPHLLKTEHDHYRAHYSPEMRRLVQDRWARDAELFGYRF